jgi:hypothetical protein
VGRAGVGGSLGRIKPAQPEKRKEEFFEADEHR